MPVHGWKYLFKCSPKKGFLNCCTTHQFISVSWLYSLTTILLDSCVFLLEQDISHYRLQSHSLWNIQTQLLEETVFQISESEQRCNSLRWVNTKQSSLKEMFLPCFKRSLTASSHMPAYGWKYLFPDSPKKGFLNFCTHTHQFNSASWWYRLITILLDSCVFVLEQDISHYIL